MLVVVQIAKEFIDRLERVVHVKKVKNNVLSSILRTSECYSDVI